VKLKSRRGLHIGGRRGVFFAKYFTSTNTVKLHWKYSLSFIVLVIKEKKGEQRVAFYKFLAPNGWAA